MSRPVTGGQAPNGPEHPVPIGEVTLELSGGTARVDFKKMKTIHYLNSLNTKTWVWMAVAVMAAGWAMDAVDGPLWVHFGVHTTVLEYVGTGLVWGAYAFLLALIPISAFRPERRFYLKGDCRLRAKRCGFVVGVNVAIFVLIAVTVAVTFSGLGRGV
jgi:hypothetical protein